MANSEHDDAGLARKEANVGEVEVQCQGYRSTCVCRGIDGIVLRTRQTQFDGMRGIVTEGSKLFGDLRR